VVHCSAGALDAYALCVIENPLAVVLANFPDISASRTLIEVDQASRDPYVADPQRPHAQSDQGSGPGSRRTGDGNRNGPGGWPDGVDNACIRFIRLKYDGPGWDDGMDAASGADINFLERFIGWEVLLF
jgi:hypothetical protein